MPLNFVETIKNYFSPGFIDQVADSLNESQQGISKALSALIPVGLGGILNISNSGKEGSNIIYDMAKSGADFLPQAPVIENLYKGKETQQFISGIFGSKLSEVTDSISGFAGIKSASTSSLMALALPPIMGFLGKHAAQNDLPASGLSGFLSSQLYNISQALPAGLSSISDMSDIGSINTLKQNSESTPIVHVTKTINEMKASGMEVEEKASRQRWIFPLILIIVVILLIWYFTKE